MSISRCLPTQVADFAIDFDACKSFVKAGNSGKYLLKPVLSVIPDHRRASASSDGVGPGDRRQHRRISAGEAASRCARRSPEPATGRFELAWIPVGTYDLVITAPGRVNAVMTGVPVTAAGATTIGSDTVRTVRRRRRRASAVVSGKVTPQATSADVRALQSLTSSTKMEVQATPARMPPPATTR